jgi:hypothetical protein
MRDVSFCSAPAFDSKGNAQFSLNQIPLNWVEPDSLTQAERKARNEARKLKLLTRKNHK